MAKDQVTNIFHITHVDNLAAIVAEGGLWSDREAADRGLAQVGIAHQHIKERRARKRVHVAARGSVADYVPFYFGPRSPMLYAVHQGQVEGYEGGQRRVLHLVSSAERAMELDAAWCFTDGHAEMKPTLFFDDWSEMDRVDWALMQSEWWCDDAENPDRKRQRQAEFLVHTFFPWSAIESVGVYDEAIAREVRDAAAAATHRPAIRVRLDWYY